MLTDTRTIRVRSWTETTAETEHVTRSFLEITYSLSKKVALSELGGAATAQGGGGPRQFDPGPRGVRPSREPAAFGPAGVLAFIFSVELTVNSN